MKSQRISTTLELDVYHARPNQHHRTRREARLDTQANGNFVSETFVEYLAYETRPYEGNGFRSALGNVMPIAEVSIFFEWVQSEKMRKRRFLVLKDSDDLPYDLILGINFINEFKIYKFDGSLLVLALAPLSSGKPLYHHSSLSQLLSYNFCLPSFFGGTISHNLVTATRIVSSGATWLPVEYLIPDFILHFLCTSV
jgi:hypothetical protein